MERKIPIGVQSFEKLITGSFLYVDKTEYLYQLVHSNAPYFLSRPRRFGKSLLLSTMKAYWEGKRELFHGLAIEKLEADNPDAWQPYPVFYFDFNGRNYQDTPLEDVLSSLLRDWEAVYGTNDHPASIGERFEKLLMRAAAQTGRKCVVLVDEYDKPLLETMENASREEHNKTVFKSFFSVLKKADACLQFVFITGVTKFSKVSIFSDLNQLRDISMSLDYAELCGITKVELQEYFSPEIRALADAQGMTVEACLEELRRTYDGYHFHPKASGVYNPFSLLNAFADKDFGAYWFATGTPTFLVRRIRATGFEIQKFTDRTLYADAASLSDYRTDNPDLTPLLYQTGYLTILDYDERRKRYTLGFPNEEVQYGFLKSLMPVYTPASVAGTGVDIYTLDDYIESGNTDGVRDILTALFASIPYTAGDRPFEHYFQAVIYLVFTLLGKFCQCEMHTYTGRIDCSVQTQDYIYLFEFKRDSSAAEALAQINSKEYSLPFIADSRTLYKIGVSFDSESRKLTDWAVDTDS